MLTDDEISEILLPLMPLKDPYVFARAVEAAVLARGLAEGGEALRLAAELGITVARDEWDGCFYATATPPGTHQGYDEPHMDDPLRAACRAIVRCAAAMASSKTPNDQFSGGPAGPSRTTGRP